MKIFICIAISLALIGCSAIEKQEAAPSPLPSEATLTQICQAGPTQTPPVARPAACDLLTGITAFCAIQSSLPSNFGIGAICQAGGFSTSLNLAAPSAASVATAAK